MNITMKTTETINHKQVEFTVTFSDTDNAVAAHETLETKIKEIKKATYIAPKPLQLTNPNALHTTAQRRLIRDLMTAKKGDAGKKRLLELYKEHPELITKLDDKTLTQGEAHNIINVGIHGGVYIA